MRQGGDHCARILTSRACARVKAWMPADDRGSETSGGLLFRPGDYLTRQREALIEQGSLRSAVFLRERVDALRRLHCAVQCERIRQVEKQVAHEWIGRFHELQPFTQLITGSHDQALRFLAKFRRG